MRRLTGRSVTVVVCDRAGAVLGETEPFEVETPWWQDVEPISRRFPALHVLRILQASAPGPPGAGAVTGGHVRYLAEIESRSRAPALSPSQELLSDHRLRMPWARPGGPAADLEWAAGVVRPTGPARQHRTWNLSSIWSIPTRRQTVWLKCVPAFFRHEAAVLQVLEERGTPQLLAADGHRILLAELPGRDGFDATIDEQRRLIDDLVDLQLRSASLTATFLAVGVPDGRWGALTDQLTAVVARRAPNDGRLLRLLDGLGRRAAAIDACGLGEVLVHGDAHAGNARIGVEPPIWFDWGDSRVGHPLLDLAVLGRLGESESVPLERHWLAAWGRAVPAADAPRAWALLQPLAALRVAATYQAFLDNIEPSEQIYHVGDVMPALQVASELAGRAAEL
ncbi:MAG: phosphotransferase [Acidimicrobiales bacterium]